MEEETKNTAFSDLDLAAYDKESIDFILDEANKRLVDSKSNIREMTNRSFILFAIYGGLLSFSVNSVKGCPAYDTSYIMLAAGLLYAMYILKNNLMPGYLILIGTSPDNFPNEFFLKIKEKQTLRLKVSRLRGINTELIEAIPYNQVRAKRYKESVTIATVSLCIFAGIKVFIYLYQILQ